MSNLTINLLLNAEVIWIAAKFYTAPTRKKLSMSAAVLKRIWLSESALGGMARR